MEGLLFRGEDLSFPGGVVRTCRFEDCTFGDSARSEFMDVIFERCDFSNADFSGSTLIRVKFIRCRMTGCDFSRCAFQDMQIIDSTALLSNWNASSFSRVRFSASVLREASFNDGSQSNLAFDHCDLTQAELFHIPLDGVDLSSCGIDGILTDPESLKGLEVSAAQAASLIRLFGLKVKD